VETWGCPSAGDEVGYISGCVRTLAKVQAAKPDLFKDRDAVLLQSMQRILSEMAIDPKQSAWQGTLETLRGNLKRLAVSLGMGEKVLRSDASKLTF
jgi:hypothetical protein